MTIVPIKPIISDHDDRSLTIVGADRVRSYLSELATECTTSLWAFQPGGAQSADSLTASRPLDEQTLARGITMRTIYLDSLRNDLATLDHARWLTQRGAVLRTAPELPMRLLLVDQETAVIPTDPDDSSKGAIVLSTPSVVAGLSALFLTVWRGSIPFTARRPPRRGTFTPQQLQALELWAQGHTDDTVARRLGVSHRTVRRVSETITAQLGSTTRFQMGLRAAELELVHSAELA